MSSTFDSIKKGLEESVAYSQCKPVEIETYHSQPVDENMSSPACYAEGRAQFLDIEEAKKAVR